MRRVTAITMTDRLDTSALIRLISWMSPSFPVGAFAYSNGLEAAVARGLVRTDVEPDYVLVDERVASTDRPRGGGQTLATGGVR